MMSVLTSLFYAAASVALLVLIFECCCRRMLQRMRHVVSLNVSNNGPYPVATPLPYPAAPYAYSAGPHNAPPTQPYTTVPAPNPATAPAAYCVSAYPVPAAPPAPATTQYAETPPPSYEQVMASERSRAPQPG